MKEGRKVLKLKLALCYLGYIIAIAVLFSRKAINIMSYQNGRAAGIVIFILLTALILYLTFYFVKKDDLAHLKAIADKSVKEESIEERLLAYYQYAKAFTHKGDRRINDEVRQLGELAEAMVGKLKNIDNLLLDTFSRTDLTYVTYKERISDVMKVYLRNCQSIKTRADTFDSKWANENNTAITFESEMQNYIGQNESILSQVDNLMLELIRLGDIGDAGAKEQMLKLIEETKDYASIKGGTK
ncbi:MAG: hypothetical protein J1F11_03325 [Oscillospiraceae bacterium]|nr:hypothetical protein [Oscillospiraceae bacterium]